MGPVAAEEQHFHFHLMNAGLFLLTDTVRRRCAEHESYNTNRWKSDEMRSPGHVPQ